MLQEMGRLSGNSPKPLCGGLSEPTGRAPIRPKGTLRRTHVAAARVRSTIVTADAAPPIGSSIGSPNKSVVLTLA